MQNLLAVVVVLVGLLCVADGVTLGQVLYGSDTRSLFQSAGLMDTLNNDGPYTLFFPADSYLRRFLALAGTSVSELRQDPAALKTFLQYHMVSGNISRSQLYNERILTSVSGQPIRVNNYGGRILTVQGMRLQSSDRVASNGMIHYLYGHMEPANGTVADIIQSQSDLSTLLTAAQTAGLVEFLIDQNPITVFAPTDAAFSALGDKLQSLLENPQLLAKLIEYHVVPGTLYSVGVHQVDLHTFEEADKLHLTSRYGQSFNLDDGHVIRNGEDISATNGVVQKIDKVLIPESLKDQI